jgi:hypothetical protein
LGSGINNDMLDVRQVRRKRHPQVIANGIHRKAGSLPVKIMVVRNGGDPGFGNQFSQGDAQGDVHRNSQNILRHQQVDIKFTDKFL